MPYQAAKKIDAKGKEKQSMAKRLPITEQDIPMPAVKNTAPLKACVFNESAEVIFEKDVAEENNKFRIIGYSGGIIKGHWYWGNLAIDLKGTKFYKKRIAVLESHFTSSRIGFTTKQEISDKVGVEGEFLDNDNAQAMKNDIKKGFPMEASLFVPPSVIEYVKDGASVKVNGQTLKGPGTVFRKSIIKEVSMCVFGYDSNTKSSTYADSQKVKFNLIQENNIMSETQTETEITSVESFAEQYPDLYEEILTGGKIEGLAQGQKQERDLFKSLQEACGNDHELVVQCFSENKTVEEARQLRVEKLEKANTQLGEKVTELEKKKKPVDPAVTEFADEAIPPGTVTEGKGNEDAWKAEFAASEDLQGEYGHDEAAYVAFKKAEAEGQVRSISKTT